MIPKIFIKLDQTGYKNWAQGQPDLSNPNFNCVIDQRGIGWQLSSCDVANFYACERPINYTIPSPSPTTPAPSTVSQTTPAPTLACGEGTWVNIENRCFNFDPVRKTWNDASAACHSNGGVLVTVYDVNDTNFLYCK